jgi:D-alanine-D-alanine ligase
MKKNITIGLTYDLRDDYLKMGFSEEETAEFDQPGTINAIDEELRRQGFITDRIGHIRSLTERLVKGDRWDLVFNICEGLYGTGREAQVPAILDAYQVPYVFSGPLVLALTLDKAWTKLIVGAAGVPTPEHTIIFTENDIGKVPISFPLFAKPLSEGTGKGINENSVIHDKEQLTTWCSYLLRQFHQPVIVEAFLPGREFTVGIVGTGDDARCIGTMEIVLKENAEQNVYSYVNKEECEERIIYQKAKGPVVAECEKLALRSWRAIRGEDGGRVDIRLDKNDVPNFLEVNPLAGLHPLHSDLPILCTLNGITYHELMTLIMQSALKKIRKP